MKHSYKVMAMFMVLVLLITGLNVYSKAGTSDGTFPAAETGKKATATYTPVIAYGSEWSDELNSEFGNNSIQNITLTSTVNGKSVQRAAFCIEPGVAIPTDKTYVSSTISNSQTKKFYKAAINYYYNTGSIDKQERRVVTQLFVWRIQKVGKSLEENEEITVSMLKKNSFKNLVTGILKGKYGFSNSNAESAYNEAVELIFTNGKNNVYKDTVGVVKWKTEEGHGQMLLTGEDIPQDVKVRIQVPKKIIDKDGNEVTDGSVAGCEFRVYNDRSCTERTKDKDGNNITITIGTDGIGTSTYMKYEYDNLPEYLYVKEHKAGKGSTVASNIYRVEMPDDIKDGETVTIKTATFENNAWYGKFNISKVDEDTNQPLAGVKFNVSEWDGTKYVYREQIVTNSNGIATSKNYYYTTKNQGKLKIEEVESDENHVNTGWTEYPVISKTADTFNYTVENPAKASAQITVVKYDSKTNESISGVVFAAYRDLDPDNPNGFSSLEINSSRYVKYTFTEDPEIPGTYYVKDLPYGEYYFTEEQSVIGYYNYYHGSRYHYIPISLNAQNPSVTNRMANNPYMGEIEVIKVDSESNQPLAGAQFELYIYDEKTQDYELTNTLVTDDSGIAVFGNIMQTRDYKLVETVSPDGYKINGTGELLISSEDLLALGTPNISWNQNAVCFTYSAVIENDPIKIPIEVHKVSSSSKRDTLLDLEGAEFSVYNASDIPEENWSNFDTSLYTPVDVVTTDKQGLAKTKDLPLGTYIMVETGVPVNMLPCENEVIILDESEGEKYEYEAIDPEFEAKLQIVKKDADTGEIIKIEGAGFKVLNVATNTYVEQTIFELNPENPEEIIGSYKTDTFYTDAEGSVTLPETLECGSYKVVEVTAPKGYTINETGVTFTVGTTGEYTWEEGETPLITVNYSDEAATASLKINKLGEQLAGFVGGKFVYEQIPLTNVSFTLKVAEDIFAPDGSGVLLYAKDTVIGEKTTNEDGQLVFDNLPFGKYIYKETGTQKGFVINETEYEVELTYKDQDTAVVVTSVDMENSRQDVDIKVVKKDKETEEVLSGAVFGIYAKEDIFDNKGNLLFAKDTLIEQKTTDENGVANFGEDLDYPVVDFILREIKAPAGYVTYKEDILIEALEAPSTTKVIEKELVVYDDITTTDFEKLEVDTDKLIPGATLRVWYMDESGHEQVVDEFVTTEEPYVIKGLEVGREYFLSEIVTPAGYVTSEDVSFILEDISDTQTVQMFDDITKLEITKTDITTGVVVEGATLAIYDMEGNKLYEWVTTTEPYYIEKLPVGTYRLVEELAPLEDGYVTAEDVTFTVEDTGEIQKASMQDDYTKISISKKSLVTGKYVVGAELAIFNADGIEVARWTTEEGLKQFIKMPVGTYTLKEEVVPEGYVQAEDITFTVDDSAEEKHIVMYDDEARGQISLIKADADNNKIVLAGAEYTIYDEKGKEVEVLVTDENGYAISSPLSLGWYTVEETKAPAGYQISDNVYKVNVEYKDATTSCAVYDIGIVTDEKIPPNAPPKTGDFGSNTMTLCMVFLFLLLGSVFIFLAFKMSDDKKKKPIT